MRPSTRPVPRSVRSRPAKYPPGGRNSSTTAFTRCTYRVIVGGQDGTLADTACVIEAAAAALLPGPLLSTVTASAVANLADASVKPLLTDLAAGATAVVVLPEHCDVQAVSEGNSWRLNGASGSVLGICAAQRILLPARAADGSQRWFVITPSPGLTIESQQGTDLCTDVGVVELADHVAAGQPRRYQAYRQSGPAASWWPSPRVLPPEQCAAALTPQPNTSARVSSSADRSALSRRCNTKQRRCW